MGNFCTQVSLNEIDEVFLSPDIQVKDVKEGSNEKYFKKEPLFNKAFGLFQINDYFQTVYSFTPDEKGSENMHDLILIEKIPILFKNKFFKNPLVLESGKISEEEQDNFIQFIIPSFKFLQKNYKALCKKLQLPTRSHDYAPLISFFPAGFLYCSGNLRNKFSLFYNLVADKGTFISKDSTKLYSLIYFMLIVPSNIFLLAINELAKDDDTYRRILPEEDFYKLYDIYQVKDAEGLAHDFINKLFQEDNKMNYPTFEERIVSKELHWLFYPKGIRCQFEIFSSNSGDS